MFKSSVLARCISTGIRQLATVPKPAFPTYTQLHLRNPLLKALQPLKLKQPQIIQDISEPFKQESLILNELGEDNTIHMDSVLRKRRLKMKKHKLRKRRRTQRALKKRLGKI